tara:strand:+ start:114 stop:824 length:711 start_codon:yes stop_codon:yes gene_type:complete
MKFSLIIPCYNEALNLPLLFNRLKEFSNVENIEVIIVDNGSTDNSIEKLEQFAKKYSFINCIRIEKNQGYGNGILEGLKSASGQILSWTHADMQTDPKDVLEGMKIINEKAKPEKIFIKGKRFGRPILDVFFTVGMSLFESVLLKKIMWDINAQPTIFHRDFFNQWKMPPKDFSLDLYAYFMAKKYRLKIIKFPVRFAKRAYGVSHWNVNIIGKLRFIRRTLAYSFELQKRMKKNA